MTVGKIEIYLPHVKGMTIILRVALTFNNPSIIELIHLRNLLWHGQSLTQQTIHISSPDTTLVKYTDKRLDNLFLLRNLSIDTKIEDLLKS